MKTNQIHPGTSGDCAGPHTPLNDRWLEGDFRFFDKENPSHSVAAFFGRFKEFYAGGKEGVVGIMINVGWFADVVLAYPGSLEDRIPLAVFKPLFGENSGQTLGEDAWSYGQIAGVVSALREGARLHLGRPDFRVGLLLLGWSSIYYAHTPVWFQTHRESFRWGRCSLTDPACLFLDWASRLRADASPYAAYPRGIPAGTPLPEFFAAQWAALAGDTGFDTLLLRDGMLGLANYRHASPAWDAACFEGTRTLLREIKQRSPATMTIGYSVAGSALAELRCHSFDLRTLARDGFLDAWITQTWGCNWIEQKRLELTPAMQTAILLAHRALLEGTGVKHYAVLNMLDAYEFLTLKTFADRWQALKWEIWAYTHAALRRFWDPEGTWGLREGSTHSLASGLYGAWFHVRDQLLEAEETDYFTREIEAAVADARALAETGGPEMVVHDSFARTCNLSHEPHAYHGEHLDETVGLLIRAGIPILTASRVDERDYGKQCAPLILHNPVGLPLDLRQALNEASVALVVGPPEQTRGFEGALEWNPAETLDPLGDGRCLRYETMPTEVADLVAQLRGGFEAPFLDSPASACIHFHYWKSAEGVWSVLLGNIESGAGEVTARLVFPCQWLADQGLENPRLLESGEAARSWEAEVQAESAAFSILLPANHSLLCRLLPAAVSSIVF